MTTEATPAASTEAPAAEKTETTETKTEVKTEVKADATSLLDTAKPAEGKPEAKKDEPKADEPAWFLAEGVPGTGKPPEWYKSDKYKSVDEQAKAYPELEKRFGAFKGAPKDGKYEAPKLPENVEGEFLTDHPMFTEFTTWAAKNQLSQEAYNDVLGMLAQYEASQAPDMGEIKKAVGDNADARIAAIAQWGKANLDDAGYQTLREATAGPNAAAVFKVLEAVVAKTRQVQMPKPGQDLPAAQAGGIEAIQAAQAKKNDQGQRLYDIDPKYRAMVEKQWADYYANQSAA